MKKRWIIFPIALLLLPSAETAGVELRNAVFATKDAGKVVFSHQEHMGVKSIRGNCKSCHNGIFDMKKRVRHTMAEMEQGKSCGACHNGKQAFSLSRCSKCHEVGDVIFQVAATGPTKFSHKKHAARRQCSACHPELYRIGKSNLTGMAAMEEGKSCGTCHDGRQAFSIERCSRCHPTKEIKFRVKEAGVVDFSHKRHTAISRCENCHTKIFPTSGHSRASMADMARGKSCGTCHNGFTAFGLEKCAECHPVKDKIEFMAKWNAKFDHRPHLTQLSCGNCHPNLFAAGRNNKSASMADMEKGKSCGTCHDGKTVFGVRENCVRCHSV